MIDDSNLLNPTTLLPSIELSISKWSEYGQRSCNRGDQNAANPTQNCEFVEGESAIAVASYPTSVFSTAGSGIKPGQLNIDIISATACISTGQDDSHVAFDSGSAQCGGVNPSGSCGCMALLPKRTIPLTNTECQSSNFAPVCHQFECVAGQCQYGRRHGASCSAHIDCNAGKAFSRPLGVGRLTVCAQIPTIPTTPRRAWVVSGPARSVRTSTSAP